MHRFTIGVEEEYQIIDIESRDLVSHVSKIIEGGKATLHEHLKHEMHESVVEMETGICQNIKQAKIELTDLRKRLCKVAHENGLRVSGGGTHPFSDWKSNQITKADRYDKIVSDLGDVARSNLIFGLHVHIGIPDREEGVRIQNVMRYFLPHIYALSTNSPFWIGRNTGFKSYRQEVFAKFPRTGIPSYFSSAAEFDAYVNLMIKTGTIDNAKKIWWDLRVHPFYPTIEFRICDMPLRIDETVCLAAIMQALTAKIYKLHQQNMSFRSYRRLMLNENKWRASKDGIHANLIDFGKETSVPYVDLLKELLGFIDDVVDELDSRQEVEYAWEIMKNGTGADRQLAVFEKTHDLKAVVDYMISETEQGIC
ncbi:carboxylate-amine ligase [Chryseobacterium suipulveris]|uniref:Putative glutamate--cysteine ligase 2 n=1 Tax=Chryseobacterium suipulveris TaxID=2929800 RepID=A0ABY4BT56_9FLAO|nr:carboxylate-amine ligase [Chryseobacterium suipulveris]UOE42380.1 carboxylate-amine ligase [Chryseobacterium suipulveris]